MTAEAADAPQPFNRIGVVGLGLVGGSVALAARRAWPGIQITGVDRPHVLENARQSGVADRTCLSVSELDDVELIVLATPVRDIIEQMHAIAAMRLEAIVTDVGSTKRAIMHAAAEAGLDRFIGGHPMAGAAAGGFGNARADLFDRCPWWVSGNSDPLLDFVRGLGAVPRAIDAITHDRVMAYVSHLPQLLASALAASAHEAVGDVGLACAGQGFRDMTRLAGSTSDVWRDILATNADFVSEAARAFVATLPASERQLDDDLAIDRLFARGRAAREQTERRL